MSRSSLAESIITTSASRSKKDSLVSQFKKKLSQNLYIGLVGPIGSRLAAVRVELEAILKAHGYNTIHIVKISEDFDRIMEDQQLDQSSILQEPASSKVFRDYRVKQQKGNLIRKHFEDFAALANFAVREIHLKRVEDGLQMLQQENKDADIDKEDSDTQQLASEKASTRKIAFIIDQLKRPEEVEILRQIYGNLFFVYAVVETKRTRKSNLIDKGLTSDEADDLISIDRSELDLWGQRMQETVLEADYFHNNNDPAGAQRTDKVKRFVELVHGKNGLTPTQEEFGMHQAYTASLGSACLSRQVGAAILDPEGNLLSVGRNDVPKFGGGLYEDTHDNPPDNRCVHQGYCANTKRKSQLRDEISNILHDELGRSLKSAEDDGLRNQLVQTILDRISDSPIKDIVEYSRSIHAEMDAIISLSRKGIKLPGGAKLYSTTFPCHMCARHIVTAGIEQVIYIEPYEKSLAIDLHEDSITTTDPFNKDSNQREKVEIRSFQGVAPRRYLSFFKKTTPRKDESGDVIDMHSEKLEIKDVHKHYVVPLFILEQKCIKEVDNRG